MTTNEAQVHIGVDFESRSRLDISDTGATQYARDPSTSVLMLGYASKHNALKGMGSIWDPGTRGFPPELLHAIEHGWTFVAHNSQFDRTLWYHQLTVKHGIPLPQNWLCTAVRCSVNGLPRGLDEACRALGLPGKDKDGAKLLSKFYKPDARTKEFREPTPDERRSVKEYCITDIQRMFQLMEGTKPLSEWEQEYFELDQRINERGFAVDAPGVERLLEVLELAYADIDRRAAAVPGSPKPTAVKALMEWLARQGCELPNLQAQTIEDALAREGVGGAKRFTPQALEVLKLRQLAGLAAPKKLKAFKQRSHREGDVFIIRDAYVVNGGHTGRHTSKGAQAQNLKRDCATEEELESLLEGDLETTRALYDEPLALIGIAIRPMVKARVPGTKLLIGDFSKIETCVSFWLASATSALAILAAGGDLYKRMASTIFKVPESEVTGDQRQLGKKAILGLGFGMGWAKFVETCARDGTPISDDLGQTAVSAYREEYRAVYDFWYTLEKAVKSAINGTPQSIGPLKIAADGGQLVIMLPSGRKLRYQKPGIEGGRITYWQDDPKTHQWSKQYTWGGKLFENIVQAIANDLQRVAALALDAVGFDLVMHSHDELVAEGREELLGDFLNIMALKYDMPVWAKGIPISVEGKATEVYRK